MGGTKEGKTKNPPGFAAGRSEETLGSKGISGSTQAPAHPCHDRPDGEKGTLAEVHGFQVTRRGEGVN